MATGRSRLVVDTAARNQLLYGRGGAVYSYIQDLGNDIQRRAKMKAPVDKGPLRSSIRSKVQVNRGQHRVSALVGSNLFYAIYQELGTGIYGPAGRPIVPTSAPFLVFRPKGASYLVRARSVRGSPARHYLREALREAVAPLPIRENNQISPIQTPPTF